MLEELRLLLETRLQRKRKRAEDAFVRAHTIKESTNCRHGGPCIGGQIHICRLKCQGADESSAAQCWPEKARGCSEFSLARSIRAIKDKFNRMTEDELALRWPSLGELMWVYKKLLQLVENCENKKTPPNKSSLSIKDDSGSRSEKDQTVSQNNPSNNATDVSDGPIRQGIGIEDSQINNGQSFRGDGKGFEETPKKALLANLS